MRFISTLFAIVAFASASSAADQVRPLVDAVWLAAHSADLGVVVVDARSRAEFDAGHIPRAVHTDYGRDGWRVRDANGTPGMFPDDAEGLRALATRIGDLGIGNESRVVLVPRGRDEIDLGVATRIYWTFKVLGHDRVSILDGGMISYLADGDRPLTREIAPRNPRTFAVSLRRDMLVNETDVRQAMHQGRSLIDARPLDQFQGRTRSGVTARPGTIPGARSVPAASLVKAGRGAFQPSDALTGLFAAAGVGDGDGPILFCNTGHWASVNWFVASELLGAKGTRLYDGSMAAWSADPANPVETGSAN